MSTHSNGLIKLTKVKLSFPHIIKPGGMQGMPPAFSADFVMEKNHPSYLTFKKRCDEVALEKFKDKAGSIMKMILQTQKLRCFGNGSEKVSQDTGEVHKGYDGESIVYISARQSNLDRPPYIVTGDRRAVHYGQPEFQDLARRLYGGCFVNAVVKPYPQDNEFGKGIRCEFISIQFAGEGEAFGAPSVIETVNLYDEVEDTDMEDSF